MTRIGKVRLKLNDPGMVLHTKVLQHVVENGKRGLAEFHYSRSLYDSWILPGGIVRVAIEYRRVA